MARLRAIDYVADRFGWMPARDWLPCHRRALRRGSRAHRHQPTSPARTIWKRILGLARISEPRDVLINTADSALAGGAIEATAQHEASAVGRLP